MHTRQILRWAFGLAAYQIVLYFLVTGGKIHEVHWDSEWYRDIAVNGYSVSHPLKHDAHGGDNISFFPAYPIWVRLFLVVFGLNPDVALYVASFAATVILWGYLLGVLKQLEIRVALTLLVCGLLLVQPGSFYNVIGYSEPLFSAALLGFVFWTHRFFSVKGSARIWAALALVVHGGVLSSTRFLGVALCGYPLLWALCESLAQRKPDFRRLLVTGALSAASLWGFVAYLAYCQLRWGSWDLYWEANRVGWGVYLDPWRLFRWSYYRDIYFFGNMSEVLGRQFTMATLGASIALLVWGYRRLPKGVAPLALALLNLGFVLQTMIGSHGMHSMVRYLVPIDCLFFPLAALWVEHKLKTEGDRAFEPRVTRWATLVGVSLLFFALQILFSIRYSRSDWVS